MALRALTLFTLLAYLPAAPAAIAIEPTTVAKSIERSMVRVIVEGPVAIEGGSGFFVSSQGHIATAYHVVQQHMEEGWALSIVEAGATAENRRSARVVHSYPGEDLAIIQVDGSKRQPLVLSESGVESLRKGSAVFAVGYPGAGERLGAGSGASFTVGITNRMFIGAWTRESPKINIIQHSAATNPGASGGPVVNSCGQVVGLNTEREMAMLLTPAGVPIVYDVIQGVFFASHVSVLLEKLKALGIPHNGSHRPCRVILGVASTNFHWYASGAIFVIAVTVLIFFRRRRVRLQRQREKVWRLRCIDMKGGPIEIVITQDDLRQTPEGWVIGCDPSCDHHLEVDGIARQHAQLVPLGDDIGVIDLHSKTGTVVNEHPVDPADGPAPLASGSLLRLGNIVFRVDQH